MHQFIIKHLLFLGLFLYSSSIWPGLEKAGGFGSGNKEQYFSRNIITAIIMVYFSGITLTYLLLCYDIVPWAIAENPFTCGVDTLDVVGAVMVLYGTWIRSSATRTLKKFFTYQVSIKKDHKLITSGPYEKIRHPSYLGTMMALFGLSILLHMSTYGYLVEGLAMSALPLRIKNEEMVLQQQFGDDYKKWKANTNYLIPYVF